LRLNAKHEKQITCLFWFETPETLRKAEELSPSSSPIKRLRDEALPSSGFRKWVVTILSTTQVTQNVILLALLFIYRLKTINPAVKGRSGSEYRLLTVALMLGNKCKCRSKNISDGTSADKMQFSMTIPTRIRRGLKCQEYLLRRFMSWKSNF
jgi:hypothetical protein